MKENRNLLIGIVLGILIGGTFSFLFLNNLIKGQTRNQQILIARQTEQIDSIRQSGMAILLKNVLDKLDDELKNTPKRILSDETIARITAFCYSSRPYTDPMDDSLSTNKLSPERGYLLLALSGMNIDSGSIHKIMLQASFTGADLPEADLSNADLSGADLRGANLKGANLQGANFIGADLRSANLWGANMRNVNLNGADLKRADLQWADLNEAELKNANLNGANLTSAQLRNTDLSGATIQWADLTGAFLNNTQLDSADLTGTNLVRSSLKESDLSKAKLNLTNLTETNLTGANLSGVELIRTIVSEENWLVKINDWHITGAQEIQNRYKIVAKRSKGQSHYHLEKIEEPNSKPKN